jgi:transposase
MHVENHLPPEDLQRLAQATPQKRIWRRFQAVLLACHGQAAVEIARNLGCSPRAVQKWITQYNRGGPSALQERPHPGRPPRLAGGQRDRFRQRVEAGPQSEDGVCTFHVADLRRILQQEFGVRLGRQATYDLLHRLGFSSLMPRPQHPEADEQLQAIFKEVVVDQIAAIAEAHPDEKIQLWFEDEARFGQQGTVTRVWARRGSRPRGLRQNQRISLYVLTAVCIGTGAAVGLITPELRTTVVNQFLNQLSQEVPAGVHAVLLWDGAGYHVGKGLKVPKNLSVIRLVPYSPELNPVENLWHYLRSHYWSLRVYPDYEALEVAALAAWRAVCLDPDLVQSICAAPYLSNCA